MRSLDLVTARWKFFAFSGFFIISSFILLAIPPTLRPGIEFTAGTTTLLQFHNDVSQADLRSAYADLGHSEARIQSTGDNEYLIRTSQLHVPDSALVEVAPGATSTPGTGAEIGTVLLGADGASGDLPLRVFQFGDVCDFGDEIASYPAGTVLTVFAEFSGCDLQGSDQGLEGTPTPTETPTEGEQTATATPSDGGETATATPSDGEATATATAASGPDVYRVQAPDGTTGFVLVADTHDFREPGVSRDSTDSGGTGGTGATDDTTGGGDSGATGDTDLGERGQIEQELRDRFGDFDVLEFASVSAVVSKQAVRNASVAVVVAAVFIMGYIVFAFSSVPRPLRYATCAIVALAHDTIIVLGAFSLFGKVFGTEINLMFVTGLLTVIGFSVHDTIIVFDRIRENVRLAPTMPFAQAVNGALVQTLGRSLNTSLTLLFSIIALLLLGGETIQAFLLVLLVGVVAGSYSSIAIAAQLLVSWEEGDFGHWRDRLLRRSHEETAAT